MARERRVLCMPMTLDEDDGTKVSIGMPWYIPSSHCI